MNRRHTLQALAGAATLLASPLALSQGNYPGKIVSLVVPYSPGGPTDAMARVLATAIKPELGQTMIVENKPGAGSNIGAEYVARADADGHTLLFGTSAPLGINLYLYPKINYDPFKSFAPVIQVGYLPNVLVVHPSVPARNVKELIAHAKANPGKLAFASSGSGASSHLAGELFNMKAGTDVQHIPYKGTGPALNDLLGGQVAMSFTDVLTALPHIKAGKLRALAVLSETRSPALPDVPTYGELGLPQMGGGGWFGVVAPAGTPAAVVAKLNAAIHKAMQHPDFVKKMDESGARLIPGTPAQFAKDIEQAVARYDRVSKLAKIRID